VSDAGIFQAAWNARFTTVLPNPLDPALLGIGFIYRPDPRTTGTYTISAGQIDWDCLGIGKKTPVWGYGNYEGVAAGLPVTFPGRTIEVQRNQTIKVNWVNNLMAADGTPLPHLLPIDQTITMQNVTTGVPIAVHHHGGDQAFEFDGGPDQWVTPVRVQTGPAVNAPGAQPNADKDGLSYTYDNPQEASLTWYHDHAEGVTRINAYAGLAGLYVIRDANEAALIAANAIPSGDKEVALVLQDRCFAADGSMAYAADPAQNPAWVDPVTGVVTVPAGFPADNPTHMPEMFGDVMMVNGVAWPNYDVEAAQYRVRLLNGSDARFYTLNFGAAPVWHIGTELGFLNAPVPAASVTISPGERIDLVVDFSKLFGQRVEVTNSAATPFPAGAPVAVGSGADVMMRFSVVKTPAAAAAAAPAATKGGRGGRGGNGGGQKPKPVDIAKTRTLRGLSPDTPVLPAVAAVPRGATVRRILLGEGSDEYGRIMPLLGTYDPTGVNNHGTLGFNDPATETPQLGSNEVWEFWNTTVDSHPVHIHLVKFRILSRQAFTGTIVNTAMNNGWTGVQLQPGARLNRRAMTVPAFENGWKDTVICPPGQVTRVLMSFNRPGKFVYHCHILSHEEHDMMRWFVVA
jgi:spore coat protein A